MGTVIAVETDGGAAIAGDSLVTDDGTVVSEHVDSVFDFDGVGAGATGSRTGVNEFEREFGAKLRSERLDADGPLSLDRLAAVAARVTETAEVEAVLAAYDDDGTPRIMRVGGDGSVTQGPIVALGTGAALALGALEDADLGVDVDGAAALVRDVLESVADRDTETGGEIQVWTLPADGADATDGS